jgi:hypothetical protein
MLERTNIRDEGIETDELDEHIRNEDESYLAAILFRQNDDLIRFCKQVIPQPDDSENK